jgi:Tfp pilus assembly protein PilV
MRIPSLTREDGFTVVEVMVAALILVVGVAGSVTLVDGANATTLSTRAREGATNLAREVVEDARSVPYADVAPGTIEQRLRAKPGLDADPSSSTWRISRRGFTYTVTAAACTVDEAKDGAGSHDNGSYCSGSAAPGTADRDPEDYKRVTVEVRWTMPTGGTKLVRQTGIVPNPGGSIGVSIDVLSGPTDITSSGSNATYSVTTDRDADSVEWWVDGIYMGEATGSGQDWAFTWTSDACEGVHHVTAQAFDQFGRSAGTRSLTVKTHGSTECTSTSDVPPPPPPPGEENDPPTTPGTLTLTTQGSKKIQLNWGASTDPDGDSIEYRVYRDGSLLTTVSGTDYTDNLSSEVPHSYHVKAVDEHGAESPASNTVEYWPPGYTP